MDREAAWELLCEYTKGEGLRKHGLGVEAVMRHFARKHGEDEETWGITGLLHDFDYERHPTEEEHPVEGAKVLRERGYPEEVVTAILGHADYTGVARETLMAKTLYAVDELAGFVTAVALVGAFQLEATFDVKDFFDSSSDFVIGLDKVDEHLGVRGGEPAAVLIEGDLAKPEVTRAITYLVERLGQNPYLARGADGTVQLSEPSYLSVLGSITSSEYARAQVLAASGVELRDDDGDGFPDTREQTSAALDYAITGGVPLDATTMIYTPQRVQTALRRGADGYVTTITVFVPGTREQSTIAEARKALDRDLVGLGETSAIVEYGLTGSPFVRQEQLRATTRSLQTSIPVAAVAALLLLVVAMRSVRYALVTVLPIGLVVVWLYAIMYVTGFALNFVTATIGAVSIGVGIDYSIHMTMRFREELGRAPNRMAALERATGGTGMALVASALSSIVGFGIMGLAPMPLFAAYGILTAIMIFLALAASLLVLPSLLMFVTPERAASLSQPGRGA